MDYKKVEQIKNSVNENLLRFFGKNFSEASERQIYSAVALSVRDRIMPLYRSSNAQTLSQKKRTVWYLSLEYLTGKFLTSNVISLGLYDEYREALKQLGTTLETVEESEAEPGLGNGGLGRLAACFADSMASLEVPAFSCGIRYDFGLFKQKFVDNQQVEMPDDWLSDGCYWQTACPEDRFEIKFDGTVRSYIDENGWVCYTLDNPTKVVATPYDFPVCGYKNGWCNTLRLWSASSPTPVNLDEIATGHYVKAVAQRDLAETISRVLYPNDSHNQGKSLRLSQQYFFTSATLQYMIKRHKALGLSVRSLADYNAVQINDTHPAIAIPEMMRLLVDVEHIGWDDAWAICHRLFAYTNHTIMWEALENWPCYLLENKLPRIYMIICEIDRRWNEHLSYIGADHQSLSVIWDSNIRMANLCLSCVHHINGVSKLHTNILKNSLFAEYNRFFPQNIIPVTNGVTPRRFLMQANHGLSELIDELLGNNEWVNHLEQLENLEKYVEDSSVLKRLEEIKRSNKLRLCDNVRRDTGIILDPDSVFDVQVKRLHEYKRQLMNILRIIALYFKAVDGGIYPQRPLTFVFGAKASPGYVRAKEIIALINSAARVINSDSRTRDYIKVYFVENYCATSACTVIPAADVSEQISLSGKEASGTGNMKFMMNGAVTLGTLDGANVEMFDLLGNDNIYIFGLKTEEIAYSTYEHRSGPEICSQDIWLNRAVRSLGEGLFGNFSSLMNYLLFDDTYMCLTDYGSYAKRTNDLLADYENRTLWNKKSLINIARSGYFSSDRAIRDYCNQIWNV